MDKYLKGFELFLYCESIFIDCIMLRGVIQLLCVLEYVHTHLSSLFQVVVLRIQLLAVRFP